VAVNGKIWSVAGGDWGKELTEILEYDRQGNTWKKIGDIPLPRSEHSTLESEGKLYLLGGCSSALGLIREFYVMDTPSGQWTKLQGIPAGLHFPGVTLCDGVLYICGGSFGLNRYDGYQKTLYGYPLK